MKVFLPYHCFMKQLKVIKQHFFSLTQLNFWNQALAEAQGTYGSSREWFRTYRGPFPNSSFSTVKRTTQYRGPSLVWNGTNQAKEQVSYRTSVLRTVRAVKRTHSVSRTLCVTFPHPQKPLANHDGESSIWCTLFKLWVEGGSSRHCSIQSELCYHYS